MTENERLDQLDRALEARLFDRDDPLLSIAADLVEMPSTRFRTGILRRLQMAAEQRSSRMTATTAHTEAATPSVIPYLIVPDAAALIDFVKVAFNAEETMRVPDAEGKVRHSELRIGDAAVNIADGAEGYPPQPLPLHLYLEDADAAYARAIAAGATSLREPVDQPYGDREGSVRDMAGNNWYIATHRATGHKPAGMRSLTPYLHAKGAPEIIAFLEGAFGAETLDRYTDPDGRVAHAKLRLGNAMIELSEAHGPWGVMPGAIRIFLDDVDTAYEKALKLGGKSIFPPENKPYGERAAGVTDPNGHSWFLSHPLDQPK